MYLDSSRHDGADVRTDVKCSEDYEVIEEKGGMVIGEQ